MKTRRPKLIVAVIALLVTGHMALAELPAAKAAENRIYAQVLVNDLVVANPDVLLIGLHAPLPTTKERVLIAGNVDPLGTRDGAREIAAATEKKTIMPKPIRADAVEVILPLKAAPGNVIGALSLLLKRQPDESDERVQARAVSIGERLATKIPSTASLFRIPAPWMSQQ